MLQIDAALYTPASGGVPDGWKLVPIEPTEEMLEASHRKIDWCRNSQNTSAMNNESQRDGGTTCERDLRDAYNDRLTAAPFPAEEVK